MFFEDLRIQQPGNIYVIFMPGSSTFKVPGSKFVVSKIKVAEKHITFYPTNFVKRTAQPRSIAGRLIAETLS